MKRLLKLAGLAVAGVISVSTINAQVAGRPYFAIDAGVAFQQDIEIKRLPGEPSYRGGVDIVFDPGARVDLMGGYNFTEALSAELELGIIYNEVDKIQGPGGSFDFSTLGVDFDLYQFPIIANLIYKIPVEYPVKPFIGVGAGAIINVFKVTFAGDDDFERAVTFGYQGLAGISYEFTEDASIGLVYKFLGSTDADFAGLKTEGTMSHSILVGFNFTF